MRDGYLDDGEIAALARQAVDELGPDIDLRIRPRTADDPYRRGSHEWTVWPSIDGPKGSFGIYVDSTVPPAPLLAYLLEQLGEFSGETARFRGVAFPPCPGHTHPADISVDAGDVVLSCPDSGEPVRRITPVVAPGA